MNDAFVEDLRSDDAPGEKTRAVLLERLALAKKRLKSDAATTNAVDRQTKRDHRDRPKGLKSAAARRKHVADLTELIEGGLELFALTLLPGTEITVSNVHVLSVFPPEWYVPPRLVGILNDIGIPEAHWGRGFDAAASSSVQTTLELVDAAGGIAIPAHANSDFKGVLRLFKEGLALTKVLDHPCLVALETIGGSVLAAKSKGKKGKDACETARYLEKRGAKPLTFIKGSDAHECRIEKDGTGEDIGQRYTFVKLDIRPNDTPQEVFRTLRLALSSGYNRVVECPTEDGYNPTAKGKSYRVDKETREGLVYWKERRPAILAVTAKGGYAGDLSVRFNPYLNNVIGSAGKSRLVRIIGYAFGAQSFETSTSESLLPNEVRAYWRELDQIFCIERIGRNVDPDGDGVQVRWYELSEENTWDELELSDEDREELRTFVTLWPAQPEGRIWKMEESFIADLVQQLSFSGKWAEPLLIDQPREIFNSARLFEEVLSRPHLRNRQVIWSTGSANVPTALDAEKIIVTAEKAAGSQIELVCGGDLHEDEIRDQLLNHFEGGVAGFTRRVKLYGL